MIVDHYGRQSKQTDVIIYDRRILPPFINQEHIGVVPFEAVVHTIEVKSIVDGSEVKSAHQNALDLKERARSGSLYTVQLQPPGTSMFGYQFKGPQELKQESTGREWLANNLKGNGITGICVLREMSWMKVGSGDPAWKLQPADEFCEETKRFIGIVLDNLRTHAERNYQELNKQVDGKVKHFDLNGIYIRDNPQVKRLLESHHPEK